jgi:bifunctional DNase/RNase
VVVTLPAPVAVAATAEADPPRPKEPEAPRPPKDYVEMTPLRLDPTPNGAALMLADEASGVLLPVYIGGTEALSIQLRMEKRRYERPLTHDLLDAVMQELGGELWKVQVDEMRQGTFIGRVFIRKGDRIVDVDARPSDAVALAIGARVPIYVARRVLDQAGVHPDEGDQDGGASIPPPLKLRRRP